MDGVCLLFVDRPPGVLGALREQVLEQTLRMCLFPQGAAISRCVKEILPRRRYTRVHMAARCFPSVHARCKIVERRQQRRSHGAVSGL